MIEPKDDVPNLLTYLLLSIPALLGGVVRVGQSLDPATGKFNLFRLFLELPSAALCGVFAVGVGNYYNINLPIIGAISGLFGLLGSAFISTIVSTIISLKLGTKGAEK